MRFVQGKNIQSAASHLNYVQENSAQTLCDNYFKRTLYREKTFCTIQSVLDIP